MTTPKTYTPRPRPIEAMRIAPLDYATAEAATKWCRHAFVRASDSHLVVSTPAGEVSVEHGDYIVRELDGQFNVIQGFDFAQMYEEVK